MSSSIGSSDWRCCPLYGHNPHNGERMSANRNRFMTNRMRPVTLGRSNWLFAGSLRAGRRAAVIMSLIQSAKLNGHDPYSYLKDVLERLPTHPASRIDEFLPHRWRPTPAAH